MSTIKTKYSLKEVVYNAYCENHPYTEPCPDCDGYGYWALVNKDQKVGCHTCNKEARWHNTPGKITKYKYFPRVFELTIGQIQATIGHSPKIQYMCKETGIGSGTLWPQEQLTDNYDTAREAAKVLAERRNNGEDVQVEELYLQMGGK